jgi:hypothetical protein
VPLGVRPSESAWAPGAKGKATGGEVGGGLTTQGRTRFSIPAVGLRPGRLNKLRLINVLSHGC